MPQDLVRRVYFTCRFSGISSDGIDTQLVLKHLTLFFLLAMDLCIYILCFEVWRSLLKCILSNGCHNNINYADSSSLILSFLYGCCWSFNDVLLIAILLDIVPRNEYINLSFHVILYLIILLYFSKIII